MRCQVALLLCVCLALVLAPVPAQAAPMQERGAGQDAEEPPAWDWPPGPSVIFDPTTGETLRMPDELRGLPPEEVYAFSEELRAEGDERRADTLFAFAGYMGYPPAASNLARLAFGEDWPDDPSRVFYLAHLATERSTLPSSAYFWLAIAGAHPKIALGPEQIEIWTLVTAASMAYPDQEPAFLDEALGRLSRWLGNYTELLRPVEMTTRRLQAKFDEGSAALVDAYAPVCEGPDLPGRDVFCANVFLFDHGDDPKAMRFGSFALSNLDLRFVAWYRINAAQRLLCNLANGGDIEALRRLARLYQYHQPASRPHPRDVAVLFTRAAPTMPSVASALEKLLADMSAEDRTQVEALAATDGLPPRC